MTGASQHRERRERLAAAGVHTPGHFVSLHVVVVFTIFDRASSDYTEVNPRSPNGTVVKYYIYTSYLFILNG